MDKKKINLEALRTKQLPRADWRRLFNVTGPLTDEDAKQMTNYFSRFAAPDPEGRCLNCATIQGGLMAALLGGFVYDIEHGKGHCSRCGYPAIANHYKVGPIASLEMILQYHPDDLQYKKEDKTNEG